MKNARAQQLLNWLLMLLPTVALLVEHTSSLFLVGFALWGIGFYIRSRKSISLNFMEKCLLWAFVLFPASYYLSFLVNFLQGDLVDPRLKYLEDVSRMLLMLPIFLLFRQIRINPFYLWNGIVIGAVAAGANAFLRYFWLAPGQRVSAAYDAIAVGDLSLALAAMSIVSLPELVKRQEHYRWIVPAAFLLGMASTVLSGTRGAWIAIPALMLILFFFMGKYWSLVLRASMIGVCVVVAAVLYMTPSTNVATRIHQVKHQIENMREGNVIYGGATFRLLGIRAAAKIFQEDPVIGVGPGNYRHVVRRMISEGELDEMTARHSNPGNAFLAALANGGLVGLLSLIGIFIAPFWISVSFIRTGQVMVRSVGFALMVMAVSMAHFGQFEAIFHKTFFPNIYVIMVAALAATGFSMQWEKRRSAGALSAEMKEEPKHHGI